MDIPPSDACSHEGCDAQLHHCCQTEWESHHYHQELPDGAPGDNPSECTLMKRCILHHLFGQLAIKKTSPSDDAGSLSCRESDLITPFVSNSKDDKAQKQEQMVT